MSAEASPVRIVPAATLDDDRRTELFNLVYSDYDVPMRLDAAALREHVRMHDVDLDASVVALSDGTPAGIALLALRGERAWIAGMGVAPQARRTGLGRALMHDAIAGAARGGAREVVLEVLQQNERARRLYESMGFRLTRALEVWRLDAVLAADGAGEIPAADARAWIAAHRDRPEPWQLGDASVDRIASPERPLVGLEARAGGRRCGAAIGVVTPQRASLLQVAFTPEAGATAARALCAALRSRAPALRALNVPAGSLVAEALRAAGATLEVAQVEMSLALPPAPSGAGAR